MALIDQKLRVLYESTNNLQVEIVDDTGFYSTFNPKGYGVNGTVEDVLKYIITLEDKIYSYNKFKYIFTGLTSKPEYINIPTVEELQYGGVIQLDDINTGEFKDSIYNLTLSTIFDITFNGDAFKGLDFISNIAGAATIESLYTAIEINDSIYKILYRENDILFLDRKLEDSSTNFKVGFYDTKELILYTGLEDCILENISKLNSHCGCNSSKDSKVKALAEIQLFLIGIKTAIKKGDTSTASELLESAKRMCKSLNCCR